MKVKKFICINCGAPKINEYKSPYIICDYCGSFTDVDYTLGLDFWKASPEKTMMYMTKKVQIMNNLQLMLSKGNRDEYARLQREYWDFYYTTYPEYLPPTINKPEEYKMYIDIAGIAMTNYAFDDFWKNKAAQLSTLQSVIRYDYPQTGAKVKPETFYPMAEFYIQYVKDSLRDYYSNPEYEIMNELLPPTVHVKMKLSMFVQIWLPYLNEIDANKFLKMSGLSLEYVELKKPEGRIQNCINCNEELFVPAGSYKVYCEKCRKINTITKKFICMSCGAENDVPDNPSKPINCLYCGTENRLIQPLFG